VSVAIATFKSSRFSPELREQMEDAGGATRKAFSNLRRIVYMETGDGPPTTAVPAGGDEVFCDKAKDKDKCLSSDVLIMQPIFRFFQLLCENHNLELQVTTSDTHSFIHSLISDELICRLCSVCVSVCVCVCVCVCVSVCVLVMSVDK